MNLRSFLYKFTRLLGDFNAIRRNRVGQRIKRRMAGKFLSRLLRKL